MRSFFDTSVLLPVFLDEHIHHQPSLAALRDADKRHSFCAAHSLAELYSTLTRLPSPHRVSGEQAMLFLQDVAMRLTFISLEGAEYWSVIQKAADIGVVGGMIYDSLLAQCAMKAKAETIYTWNVSHFSRLGPEIAKRVRTP